MASSSTFDSSSTFVVGIFLHRHQHEYVLLAWCECAMVSTNAACHCLRRMYIYQC